MLSKIFIQRKMLACAAATGILLSACGSQNHRSDSVDSLVEVQNMDTAKKVNQQLNDPADPDPTDSFPVASYKPDSYRKEAVEIVAAKLRERYKDDIAKGIIDSASRKFRMYEYDLNGDGNKEIIVGLSGPYFCGSGGCSVMLLTGKGDAITYFSVTNYPVVISNTKTNNWNDLILMSSGKYHLLKFNGKTYPSNPSVTPAFKSVPGNDFPKLLDFQNEPYPAFYF